LVFDEGMESVDIATNENILLLDEHSKVKLFLIPPSLKISAGSIREWIMPFVSSTLKSFEKCRSPLFGATGNFNHQILPYGTP
jgi:hypothetical protein